MPIPDDQYDNIGAVAKIDISLETMGIVALVTPPDELPRWGDVGTFHFHWQSLIEDYLFNMTDSYTPPDRIFRDEDHQALIEDTDQMLTILADFADRIRAERKRLIGV